MRITKMAERNKKIMDRQQKVWFRENRLTLFLVFIISMLTTLLFITVKYPVKAKAVPCVDLQTYIREDYIRLRVSGKANRY